jgi:16S rRNA (guanine527-N7)-methyltransferase
VTPKVLTLDIAATISRYANKGRLDQYHALLMDENSRINLVSRETGRPDFDRLVAESLLPLELLPDSFGSYLDIGSGGGMPAIPIMLSGRVTGNALLVERTQKRVEALQRMARTLGLPVEFENRTFRELNLPHQFDLITLRYVKLTRPLLRSILAALSPEGAFVYYSAPDFAVDNSGVRSVQFLSPQDTVARSFTIIRN